MSERKQCPVDRGKVLIALECCREGFCCHECPYYKLEGCKEEATDVLAYIGWLEERLTSRMDGRGKNAKTD
ncbi:MAG: hypothetical protein ACI3W5_05780 [Faecousia sp.]